MKEIVEIVYCFVNVIHGLIKLAIDLGILDGGLCKVFSFILNELAKILEGYKLQQCFD